MRWSEVIDDPQLKDLPYKIELNEWGNIVMSPASNQRGKFQAEIIILLKEKIVEGDIIAECSVETRKGTKVADVAWLAGDFIKKYGYDTPYIKCPDLVVEIKSPSNTIKEFEEKADLYFAKGAKEVNLPTNSYDDGYQSIPSLLSSWIEIGPGYDGDRLWLARTEGPFTGIRNNQ